ncbi:uncharacterized protein NK6_a_18 (plasmid) [Bradyrhizobium diazoefficiens]|nr:uncharacterized protein NK6_a_18 [Bradyrhizobium diazoefficiens]
MTVPFNGLSLSKVAADLAAHAVNGWPPEVINDFGNLGFVRRKRRSRPIRKGLAWGLQSVDQRVCKSLAGGMEAATTENYEVRPNDQGRSSSIRDCG